MSEWVAKEDDFHLQQSRKRAAIRVREGRAKPIDLLAINLKWADPKVLRDKDSRDRDEGDDEEDDEAGLEIDLEEPYLIFENLSLDEVEELHQDIQMYLTLEKNQQHLDFWKAMVIVCDDKLDELRMVEDGANPQQRSLDPAVRSEMDTMLGNKTHEQLVGLQDQVRSKLKSGESIDVEYWEGLLKQIVVWRAKARLRDQHENVLANRIAYLRKRQRLEAERMQEELRAQMQDGEDDATGQFEAQQLPSGADADEDQAAEAQAAAAEAELLRIQTEWDETMEPGFIDRNSLPYADRQVAVVDPDEDRVKLLEARRKVLGARFVPRNSGPRHARGEGEDADASMWKQEASKPMDVEEEAFNNAEELVGKSYQWEDKYRPRKPRYFNRVHTGFEWSRYNQTHYDSVENPPPKVVQGYKFNIFYPDLIDKSKAPTYRIRKDPNDPDTAIIIFIAGPPYEDIAFRIVNKPWNLAHRRGFRASFDRGIMQLYFSFQRNFYRK
ncbi:Cactin [Ceraceosorus bombacis]|uniref:Splicing factor Cactin n=1 Tax=Ceraceosorus bombacis TaxID=401625 RepID=A0A0P1BRC6_9BASI|nr:Cactin [Ceraceosorus bombacis]